MPLRVLNLHERRLAASPEQVGALIDTLASPHDRVWPHRVWPRMAFDRPLGVGAIGGHGPIHYYVEAYDPGREIRFRFTAPAGFDGHHTLRVGTDVDGTTTVLEHVLAMDARGSAMLTWPLLYRPLHDALLEDALANAQVQLGLAPDVRPWSMWVRMLRWVMSRGRARGQRQGLGLRA